MIKKKRSRKLVLDRTEMAIAMLQDKNCTIQKTDDTPMGYRYQVLFTCNIHPEYGTQNIRFDSLKGNRNYCKKCQSNYMSETYSGENSPTWNGGKSDIRSYIRSSLNDWIVLTLQTFNYKCFITGSNEELEVHHLVGFNTILEMAEKELGIVAEGKVADFERDKLDALILWVKNFHSDNDIGVVLSKISHKEFHDIYGLGYNTLEQFNEFCVMHGKRLISDYENGFSIVGKRVEKQFGTSKYFGVSKTSNGRWASLISFKKKQSQIGVFLTEYRAAKSYNDEAIRLFGSNAKLNDLSGKKDKVLFEDKYYHFKDKLKATSIYTGVYFSNNGWRYDIIHNNKKIFSSSADSEIKAAYFYNLKKIELLGEDSILNFLSDEEQNLIKDDLDSYKYEYFEHKESPVSIYTYVTRSGKKWSSRISIDGKLVVFGNKYLTDRDAAIAYNEYVLTNKLEKKLNRIA